MSLNTLENTRGETIPESQRVYRFKVVRVFLRSGTPLNRLQHFRSLLEENALRLSDRRQMADIIPLVLEKEKSCIKEEISGKHLSIVFDGTTRLGEAFAIVVQFVDDDWNIKERLVRMRCLSKSLSGEEIARVLIETVSREYSINSELVIACMRDRASSNNATLKVLIPALIDIGCFSHTFDLCGEKMKAPTLFEFMWSKWECMKQVLEYFGDIRSFLGNNEEFSTNTRAKLLTFFSDSQKTVLLQLELAVVDFAQHFVKATYQLEGSGLLAFKAFDIISELIAAVEQANYPNLNSVTRKLCPGDSVSANKLKEYGRKCIEPSIVYFKERLTTSMTIPLAVFKAARLFSPVRMKEIHPSNSETLVFTELAAIPFMDTNTIQHLKDEFPTYHSLAADIDPSFDICQFWRNHKDVLPFWSTAASKLGTIQPSSASAERVFSLLNSSFSEHQPTTLEDAIEASLMLQFNDRND